MRVKVNVRVAVGGAVTLQLQAKATTEVRASEKNWVT